MRVTGIILIAGNSTRFKGNINKVFKKINGKYVFEYSLEKFFDSKLINDIIIAVKKDDFDFVQNIIKKYKRKIYNAC